MSFFQKISKAEFWKNVLKVSVPFLIIVTLFALFFQNGKDIFKGDFNKVYQANFADLKWVRFWLPKVVICLIYGIYITNKNTK